MFDFRCIKIGDKEWINELLKQSDFMGCEYSFANNLAWNRLYNTQICRYKDFYISKNLDESDKPYFTFPAGSGNYIELFKVLQEYSKEFNTELKICSLTENVFDKIANIPKNKYKIEYNEDSSDYIYKSYDLINLEGKKYHNKRNHLSKMNVLNWLFEPICNNNIDECIEFATKLYNDKNGIEDVSSIAEQYAINTFLNYYDKLNLIGGIIRVDGKIEAFTIGEKINSDTFDIHIEKANAQIKGMYAAINNEFAKYAAFDSIYINREEDLGIEGLRKAKNSYYPIFLLKKYTITFKEDI